MEISIKKPNHKLEHGHQVKVVKFLTIQQSYGTVLRFTANVRETYTGSYFQNNINSAAGVRKGLPDLFILLPTLQLWLELKLPRRVLKDGSLGASPSIIKPEQQAWVDLLNQYPQTKAHFAYGAEEAIKIISSYIPNVSTTPPSQTDEERSQSINEFSSFLHGKTP